MGHVISGEAIKPDLVKLDGVQLWPVPKNLRALHSFLGFLNYYCRFIRGYSALAQPLHALTRKEVNWQWEWDHQDTFDKLKAAMLSAPVLAYPDHELPYLLETDASDKAIGAVLSQEQEDGKWHPVGFMSKTLALAERNYHTHDRELLAIIRALEDWWHLLRGTKHTVVVLTDHNNLSTF